MIVRLADMETDALAIIDGARDFVSRMEFTAWLPETDEAFVDAIGRVATQDGMEIALAEQDGRIVGGIGMLYLPCDWNPSLIVAVEKFIWCDRSAPKTALLSLLRFVERRIREHGAGLREFGHLTSSPAGITRLYEKMGMRPVQTTWMGMT